MSVTFEGFNLALLDSTFFFGEFSPEIKRLLQSTTVWVSNTFDQEIKQYKQVLPQDQARIYWNNNEFILKNIQVHQFAEGGVPRDLQGDLWSLISLLAKAQEGGFVVLTANELLIQRIVLNNLSVNLYNLRTNVLIRTDDEVVKAGVQREFKPTVDHHTSFKGAVGKSLYRKNKTSITLAEEFGTGREAIIYKIKNQPDLVAKIYLDDQLSPEKHAHIQRLIDMEKPNILWAVFPKEMLYYDSACTDPAGFIENYADTFVQLDKLRLFLGNINAIEEEWLNKSVLYTVELCLKIVRQVCYLNCYGFFVSDFNLGNVAIISDQSSCLQMWDTDSYGYAGYFAGTHDGYRKSRAYDMSIKADAIEFCSDALYIMVFYLLALGDAPMSEHRENSFKYDNPNNSQSYRRKLIPDNIWLLFESVFRKEKIPSSEALLYELSVAQTQLAGSAATNQTYKQLFEEDVDGGENTIDPTDDGASGDHGSEASDDIPTGTTNSNTGNNSSKREERTIRAFAAFITVIVMLWSIIHFSGLSFSEIMQGDFSDIIQMFFASEDKDVGFELSSIISTDKGFVTISWEDAANNSPYEVTFQCVGEDSVTHPYYWAGGDQVSSTTYDRSFTTSRLISGKTYTIFITDCNGQYISGNYSIPPASSFVDGELSASSVDVTIQMCSKSHGGKDSSPKGISVLRASDIISNMDDEEYGFSYKIEYPQLVHPRSYLTQVVVIAPNGYTECVINHAIEYNGGLIYWSMIGEWVFEYMYDLNSSIPSGTWTVELYWDGMLVNSSTFMVQ